MSVKTLYPSQCTLGESPLWHEERKCCYWVDIEEGILYEYNWISASCRFWKFDGRLTLVLQGIENELVLARDLEILKFDLITAETRHIANIENSSSNNRCNDGASDASGRLWIGTMGLDQKEGAGSLYSIDASHRVKKMIGHVSISNGIAWSIENDGLYYVDSPTQVIKEFIYNERSGDIIFKKDAIKIPPEMGSPDGIAIDQEGMLWIAHWGGYGVYRWNPDSGELLSKIELPVPQVSSCAFAGENLDHLIITTARENFTEDELKKYPESGDVYIVKTHVRGAPTYKCLI